MRKKNQIAQYKKTDAIIISDTHLGSAGSQSKKLYYFLSLLLKNPPQKLIINGDFFELWSTSYKKFDSFDYKVVRKILELSQKGTKVIYIPGNHDRAFRAFKNFEIGKIRIKREYMLKHENKKYIIMHGDEFDLFTRNHIILSLIIDWIYVLIIKSTAFFKRFFGFNISISSQKKNSKKYQDMILRVKKAAIKYAISLKVDGIIIGHTHYPEIFNDISGVFFINSGDWKENCSYVIIGDEVRLEFFE